MSGVVLKEGYLNKRSRSSRPLPRFQRRYFRLYAGELQYFYSPQETVARRRVVLRLDSKVSPTNDQGIERCFVIKGTPTSEAFYVQAEKEEEKDEWVTAIYNALRRSGDIAEELPSPPQDAPSSPRSQAPPPQSPPQPPARILLQMNVLEAKGLKAVDMNGKSDPYCIVNLIGKDGNLVRSEEMRTKYVTDNLNPVWNTQFTVGNAVDLSTVEAIHLELWDHDHFMKNSSLGFVRVPLSVFQMSPASTGQSELVDRWFRVEPPVPAGGISSAVNSAVAFATGAGSGGSSPRKERMEKETMIKHHGELHLVMSIAGPNLVKFFQSMSLTIAPQSRIVTDGYEHTDNRLEVTVMAARKLIAADFNKSSDPFVELTLLDDKGKPIRGEFYRTAVIEKNRNPEWADEQYVFGRICRIDEAAQLRVRVMDWDEHSKNDPLGSVVINLDHLSAHNLTEWYTLQPEPGMAIREDLGSIKLKISLIGETRGERNRRRQIDKEIASKTHELSVEQLELENAQHQLHDAACNLDGARISCAVDDYQAKHPQFYGINGCIQHLNAQLPRAHRETASTDEGFQARAGIESQAVLEVTVLGTADLKQDGTLITWTSPYAVIEMDPVVCVEECKRTSAAISPQKKKQSESSAANEARGGMFAKRAQGEVSARRAKLGKNEVRSETHLDLAPDQPMLKVEIKSGHGLIGVDYGGYSDPYCTLTLTDRESGKPVEVEKKRTAVVSKTLNPVWGHEVFYFGQHFPLLNAATLVIHVKDHNMTRSTPLGRVQIPLSDLCHASATSTSIVSTAKEKRYALVPEPWMKRHVQNLGELCIKTEVIGDATVLAEMLQRSTGDESPGKMLSFLSMQSFASEAQLSSAGMSSSSLATGLGLFSPGDEETTEIIEKGQPIRTSIASGTTTSWRKEKFALTLSYPGMFSTNATNASETNYVLHLRVFGARNLLGAARDAHRASKHNSSDHHSHHHHHQRVLGRRAETNAYFTVIPVMGNGHLEHAEKKQSLTVYGTRSPTWPEQEFVVGKIKSLQLMSYLSLHVYTRDLESDDTKPIAQLLDDDERQQLVRVKRFQLCKVAATGIVEDDGFEVLPFDQRVLAYRKCADGGRFFPARVQKYRPFPEDEYDVLFEDGVECIDDLWDLFSLDVKGKIESIHADGTVDVSLFPTGSHDGSDDDDRKEKKKNFAKNVSMALLKPVDAFTSDVERVMARRMDVLQERKRRWQLLKHTLTGLTLDVLSVTGLPKQVTKPGCVITFVGNPLVSPAHEVCEIGAHGQLKAKKVLVVEDSLDTKAGELLTFTLPYAGDADDVHNQKRFEEKKLVLGMANDAEPLDEATRLLGMTAVIQNERRIGKSVVMQTASLMIRIVDQEDAATPSSIQRTIGYARVDLATLSNGPQDITINLLPHEDVEYYKFVGSITLRIDCVAPLKKPIAVAANTGDAAHGISSQDLRKQSTVCGASQWFKDRMVAETQASGSVLTPPASPRPSVSTSTSTSTTASASKTAPALLTRIGRRQLLRASLTPTENAQVDAFHAVLVVIMERIVSILREIQLIEEFENLSAEEMPKFHHIHRINADPASEWIGRPITELSVDTRKSIVVGLEMELLDIAASDWKRVIPSSDLSRDEWVKMRAVRQKELQKVGGFFMQHRTSSVVLHLPWCFTGEGMISWICRAPAVLWKDQWVKYCHDTRIKEACKLGWASDGSSKTKIDPDAMQAPRTREAVLLWLSTVSDAGYIENITPALSTLDANKKYYIVDDKPDRFYRLHEIEKWLKKKDNSRGKSLCPLDLVPEIDCYQQLDTVAVWSTAPTTSPSSSPRFKKLLGSGSSSPTGGAQGTSDGPPPAGAPEDAAASAKEEQLVVQKKMYAKKERDHVEGFLGLQNAISSFLFSHDVQQSAFLKPVATKTQQLGGSFAEQILWNWKYALFVPLHKSIYVYESEFSLNPEIIIDMTSTVCHAAYNSTNVGATAGGWFNVVNATVLQKSLGDTSNIKYAPINDELRDKLMKVTKDGSLVIEFKTPNAQLWVQSFVRAGVRVDMKPKQLVVLKRLNETILQKKCIAYLAYFNPNDLEGSFQRLLNKFFKHDVESSHQEHEKKMRDLRARVRTEMKKAGTTGEPVMAYYGKGQRLNPRPTKESLFTKGALYTGRLMKIRTPFADDKYKFTMTYKIEDAPVEMQNLLAQYKVHDKESWLKLPKSTRDVFLLYDVEYHHHNEIIIEEGMLREHFRSNEGDLDPTKVAEKCTDLNLYFKPSDLEDCVTRMVIHMGGRKPLGCLKIPIKTVSPHRVMDMWYPLAPENEMLQKAKLGQIRVQLKLVHVSPLVRSKKLPAMLMDDVKEAAAALDANKPLAIAASLAGGPLKMLKEKLRKSAKRAALSPTSASVHVVSRERSFLKVRIMEGRKLIAADILTSDPFVKMVLVREKDDKEEWTKQKTEVKNSTLSPKWQNEEFVLGKSQETMLSDKKALILRVMDYDRTSPDDPMGYVKLEFQRDKSGYISGLVLVHADDKGNATSRVLQLTDKHTVEVDEKLLADEKAGQLKTSSARGNNAALDGKLGKLRFSVEITQNENFVDPTGVSATQMNAIMRSLETKFSLDVQLKGISVKGKGAAATSSLAQQQQQDWKQYSCVFIPKGDGGQRIHYDVHTEDLGNGNTLKLSDLLGSSSSSSSSSAGASSSSSSTTTTRGPRILGRTYDMSRVAYFDVELRHATTGKVFTGRFGERVEVKDPRNYAALQHDTLILTEKDSKEIELHVSMDLQVVAIHRAARLKRLLAETFRIVGLEFDVRRINDEGASSDQPGRSDVGTNSSSSSVQRFLWEVCKAHVFPGRNTTQELLAQVHRMGQSTKLHWKFTPQLLGFVMEHIFLFGDKDRLAYDDAAALDTIMSRWSLVLQHVNDAKSQLIGHLHGKDTPRLIHTLMSQCDWTGFEFASLPSKDPSLADDGNSESQKETVLRAGTKVHALLPQSNCKHAGVAVDVKLANGQYVAGTIIAECDDHSFDVAFCTSAKIHEEEDGYFSDDDELPPLVLGQSVFVCPIAHSETIAAKTTVALGASDAPLGGVAALCTPGRIGHVRAIDEIGHKSEPYRIEFDDSHPEEAGKEVWVPRVWLDSMFPRVIGEDLSLQLTKDEFVRVSCVATGSDAMVAPRPAKILKNHRNGKYDVVYLDTTISQASATALTSESSTMSPADGHTVASIETEVPRERLEPTTDKVLVEGEIVHTYLAPSPSSSSLSFASSQAYGVAYDLLLKNGDYVEGVTRDMLRIHDEVFPSDKCLLASLFISDLEIQDKDEPETELAKRVKELFAHDQLIKAYVMMPTKPERISLRDTVSNQLLQSKLKERDTDKPRFVDQCHGYVVAKKDAESAKKSSMQSNSQSIKNLTDVETSKLAEIFETSALIRGDASALSDSAGFDASKCFCLYLAPQPQVELHGMLRITADPNVAASKGLFKSLASLAAKNKHDVLRLFQRLVRSAASEHMPLNRKERVVHMKSVELLADSELHLVFEVGVPHNNRGSLEYALDVAHRDATRILERLVQVKGLTAFGGGDISADKSQWRFTTSETKPKTARPVASTVTGNATTTGAVTAAPALRVQVLNHKGVEHSQPSLSLELLPLDDQRLSVQDASGKSWEICLPMDKILVEAQLRRHLVPYHEAEVVDDPVIKADVTTPPAAPLSRQVNQRSRRDSMLLSRPTETLKIKTRYTDRQAFHVRFEKHKDVRRVDEHDIKMDTLCINVLEASELSLKENMGMGDLQVEVLLKSSDFLPHAEGEQVLKTPFGVILTERGDICKDYDDKLYPQSSTQRLTKGGTVSVNNWVALQDASPLLFRHPGIDMERVTGLTVRVLAKETKALIGMTFIPISAVPVTTRDDAKKNEFDGDATVGGSGKKPHGSSNGAKWVVSMLSSKKDKSTLSSLDSNVQTFSLYPKEGDVVNVVGKIKLALERTHCVTPHSRVLARRLVSEADAWKISDYELLALTLKQHDDQLLRGLLATSTIVPHGGLKLLHDPIEKELQLQKIVNVMLISHAMEKIYATSQHSHKGKNNNSNKALTLKDGSAALSGNSVMDQMKQLLDQTKWLIEDTAAEFGIRTTGKRLPWSANSKDSEDKNEFKKQFVIVRANVANTATRVRRTMLKLYHMYRLRLIPTLQRLYKLDAMGEKIDVKAGEQLIAFFEEEVESLDPDDQHVYKRVYRRLRLIKIAQVLQEIMQTTLLVTVMNHDQNMGDEAIGTSYIPLIDLLDRLEHDNYYDLTKKKKRIGGGGPLSNNPRLGNLLTSSTMSARGHTEHHSAVTHVPSIHGKVHLKIRLTYSESSLLEQATMVYRFLKDKYIAQYETARRRINAAVVPAQRRRWMTIKGYLDELKAQSTSTLHWERTPVLLSLVWDIFLTNDPASPRSAARGTDEEKKHLLGLAEKASEYRSAVVEVHKRWANLQPLLEELLQIQSASQIDATRTPKVLELIEIQVEGLDLVLATAYQQVRHKWMELFNALEELVGMKERNKLHLAKAPQLLKLVTQRCSKGLNERHAEGVANVQFRWMAITQSDGPLNELRLTEKKGLHWRRTHELVLLLNEQCEGFAEMDAKTLNIVEKRWQQVQEWLEDVVQMQVQHTIDCEATPFILKKMHLIDSHHHHTKQGSGTGSSKASVHATGASSSPKKGMSSPRSPSSRERSTFDRPSLSSSSPRSPSVSSLPTGGDGVGSFDTAAVVDVDRLEGISEWYAIEEAKRELERVPFHRITTEFDKNDVLRYCQDGNDTRLIITLEEMAFTPQNVRAALADRGVIPMMAVYDGLSPLVSSLSGSGGGALQSKGAVGLPKDLLEEIQLLEQSIEKMQHSDASGSSSSSFYVQWNPERVAELYLVIESLGKSDLLWKIDHAVNTNYELEIPSDYSSLLQEMQLRQIQTTEIKELISTLLVTLQKEELAKVGVDVPPTANYREVERLMRKYNVKDVVLPMDTFEIQKKLQERGMDRKGDAVFLRGMRIGTQMWNPDESHTSGSASSASASKGKASSINTGLGIVDTKIEQLRKTLLMEALRKRNSLIKTFPGESFILTQEELAECTEVDMSGDFMTLIERFQQLLIHESYTKRLAEYASLDRCMRALLRVTKDQIVTKEDIAKALQPLGAKFRLPLEAFTQEELLEAARLGKIHTPTDQMLARCPVGKNAKIMAYYAAVSHAALAFQETVRFRNRLDAVTQRFVDAFPFETKSSVDGMSVPKMRKNMSVKEYFVDWLLGTEDTVVKIQRRLGAYHLQRLQWATAAFTLRNRWYQRGFGWCDDASKCAGVKVLLQKLLIFENANKMHMLDTQALLSEINDKCVRLRAREKDAKEVLEQRYASNLSKLDELVKHAEKCVNNRKLHAEDTPALLHAIEQACVVPHGLEMLHKNAYHVVSTHWTHHRARLAELVHMQKQGTFSIERTPELLSAMEFHTEGIAGAEELDMDKVMATVSASATPVEMQQRYVDKKVDEIRRGQRKQSSSLRLNLDDANTDKDAVLEDLNEAGNQGFLNDDQWQSLSPSKRVVQPLSPRDKQTSWKVAASPGASATSSSGSSTSTKPAVGIVLENKTSVADRRRKSSIGDEIKELLRSPSKWLMATHEPVDTIRPEIFFPREVSIHLSQSDSATATAASPAPTTPSSSSFSSMPE